MQKRHLNSLALAILTLGSATAQAAAPVEIGTPEAVIQGFVTQQANPHARMATAVAGQTMGTDIKDYYYKNGQFSITGKGVNAPNSLFVLKGNKKALRGYLVLHDSKKAFEYTTNAKGMVEINEVNISKIYPDLDEAFPMTTRAFAEVAVSHPTYSTMALRQAPHIGAYNNEDVTKLQSKPGSPYVFYLNHSAVMSGNSPINGVSKEQMYRVWQSVADQYSMYNMNITTDPAVYQAAKTANVLRTGVLNFVNQDGRSNAPLHSFGTTAAGTLYRNPSAGFDYGYGIGMTAAHEIGHQMGMLHDHGGKGGEYFEGIPAFQWGPIMGNYWQGGSWANQLFTWSKGEYTTASNFEDDLRIMNVEESVPYANDDNPSGKALQVAANGDIGPQQNFGQIEKTGDSDSYTFTLSNLGTLNLRIDPIEYLRMLDVNATIYNSAGNVVAQSNLPVHRSAEFKNLSLPADNYRLVISGGAEGTPAHGFSNYSSLGYYAMKGSLTGGVIDTPDVVLSNGVPLAGQSAATKTWQYFAVDVPAGKSKLQLTIAGSNGDADLYGRAVTKPTTTSYACKSDGSSSKETCSIANPAAGRYYVGVYAYTGYSNLSVTAAY